MRCANIHRLSTEPAPEPSASTLARNCYRRSSGTCCLGGPTARSHARSNAVPKPINYSINRATYSKKFPIAAATTKKRLKTVLLSKRHSELTLVTRHTALARLIRSVVHRFVALKVLLQSGGQRGVRQGQRQL